MGRTAFSKVWVNWLRVLGFKWTETLRANIATSLVLWLG
jgi:hypothetical protein